MVVLNGVSEGVELGVVLLQESQQLVVLNVGTWFAVQGVRVFQLVIQVCNCCLVQGSVVSLQFRQHVPPFLVGSAPAAQAGRAPWFAQQA